jgi:hypothetical protein
VNAQTLQVATGYQIMLSVVGDQMVTFHTPVTVKAQPAQPSLVQKIDIGGGYWLILGPDGGTIVREGS